MTLLAPGATWKRPTVATRPGVCWASVSTASANSAAAVRASWRSAMGTVPAWPASPVNVDADAALALDRGDDADGDTLRFEDGSLLDVDLDVAEQVVAAAGARWDSASGSPPKARMASASVIPSSSVRRR